MKVAETMKVILLFPILLPFTSGFQPCLTENDIVNHQRASALMAETSPRENQNGVRRRSVFLAPLVCLLPQTANAGIDPALLKALPVEGDDSGASTRIRRLEFEKEEEKRKEDAVVAVDEPWQDLPSGVSYREFRTGSGDAIQNGSKVAVEMTIRARSFTNADNPGGVKWYSTKLDTDFNEYAFQVGSNVGIYPALEEAILGMKKGGLRRIEIPSPAVFEAKKNNQLPLPTTKEGQRIFDRLFKTDATLLYEVLVTRVK